ncbi:hypothetical protein BIW11_08132 [Tropilaelaps mercedesae]|uniref:Monocarboxylate transporter 12-like n=1 Tax=Tropilaelaps mercedesae TaxID=418985 RepID=A0A1V9XQX8_9ACAR|nr:hypothetical protein BIW11_08132 [Tropilaelaps mercedesae]
MAICDASNDDHAGHELERLFVNRNNKNASQNTRRQQNGSFSDSSFPLLAPPATSIPPAIPAAATAPAPSHLDSPGHGSLHRDGAGRRQDAKTDQPLVQSPTAGHRTRYDSENSSSSGGLSSSSGGAGRRKMRRPPPDGGWGWMVVFASFAVNLISDGVSLSFGLFLPDLTSYFAVGKGHAAWVASLFLSMPLLAGPVASWLTDRYGCRRVCIAGSVLAALGFFFSFFSDSLALLYVTFSLAGFGLALCYVTSIVIVAYYFEKKRCLATGLSVCGSGVGTFVFAPLTYYLVEKFMWRGTLLILAGVFLNMILSGALMRDLDVQDGDDEDGTGGVRSPSPSDWGSMGHLEEGRRMCSSLLQLPTYLSDESPRLPVQVLTEMSSNEKGHLSTLLERYPNLWHDVLKSNVDDPYLTVKSSPLIKTILDNRPQEGPPPGAAQLPPAPPTHLAEPQRTITFADWYKQRPPVDATEIQQRQQQLKAPPELARLDVVLDDDPGHPLLPAQDLAYIDEREPPTKKDTIVAVDEACLTDRCRNGGYGGDGENGALRGSLACAIAATSTTKKSSSLQQQRQASLGPLSLPRDRANSAAYLRNLRLQRGSLTYRGAMLNIKRYRLKASSCPNIYRNSMATINESGSSPCEFFEDLKDVVCDMMDVRLLTNFKYALFCLSNFLLNACVDNPYVYIPDHAASLPSIQEGSGAFIISIIGVLNTLGVVIVGYVGDKPWIDPSLLYALCTIVAGASVAAIPLLRSYLPLATASAIYGFTISANYTLVPEIVVNLISLDNFTGAYGLLLLIQGIAGLIGPPIAGWLHDISGSYDTTFYISGLSILASGVLVIPVAQSWKCVCENQPVGADSNSVNSRDECQPPEQEPCPTDKSEVLATGPPKAPVVTNGLPPRAPSAVKDAGNGQDAHNSPSIRSPGSPSKTNQVRFTLNEEDGNTVRAPLAVPESLGPRQLQLIERSRGSANALVPIL